MRIWKVRTTLCAELSDCIAMVSIGFEAVAGLSELRFSLQGVAPGKVHQITRAAVARSDLHMLRDAPGGVFVVLDEAPPNTQ